MVKSTPRCTRWGKKIKIKRVRKNTNIRREREGLEGHGNTMHALEDMRPCRNWKVCAGDVDGNIKEECFSLVQTWPVSELQACGPLRRVWAHGQNISGATWSIILKRFVRGKGI